MEVQVVSVDSGRSGVKVVGDGMRDYFRAALGTSRKLRLERTPKLGDLEIEYEGVRYFAGSLAEEADDDAQMYLTSKVHHDTKVLSLAAVHKVVEDGADVMLVSGMPITNHTENERVRFRRLLGGSHELTVNGVRKSFFITRVEVAAECAAVGWSIGRRRKERFHVLDIGSRTVNFATVENGRWIDKFSGSLDYGAETVNIVGQQLARKVVADLTKHLRTLEPIVLIGGCAAGLVEHIRSYHEAVTVHADALFANAVAFRELGVLAYGQTSSQRTAR